MNEKVKGILGGFTINTYIFLALGILIIGLGVFAEFEHLKIKDIQAQLGTLNIANQIQQQTISTLQQANVAVQAIAADISSVQQDNAHQLTVLVQRLQDLNAIAIKDPSLVERKINEASDARIRCFALVTGAPLLKNEKNSVCPQIIERLKNEK